mmetsp:Transcript_2851/g.7489  ORF Transcript_2851/g.7489 Transcript_2851/m.7489 type:complete len:220 (-) Transcript_2851:1709-2368(-)
MRRGSRRKIASSRSKGRLVAASTTTCSHSRVRRPSQCSMNSFLSSRTAGCSSTLPRACSIESTSSMKSTAGASFEQSVNTARTYLLLSPSHFDMIVLSVSCMKLACASDATALASSVLPVPGGPKRRTPFVGVVKLPRQNSSGRRSGSATTSRRVSLASSSVAISSQRTPTSSGGTTEASSDSSKRLDTSTRRGTCWRWREQAAALRTPASRCAGASSS